MPARTSRRTAAADSLAAGAPAAPARVKEIFTRVAPHYDKMNDIMSLGLHRIWKHRFVGAMHLVGARPRTIIDMACGSGDITERVLARAHADSRLYAIDPNSEMLDLAKERLGSRAQYLQAPAERVKLPDDHADIYAVAFGMRNFTDRSRALAEAHRLLRRGGQFLCLEFSPAAQGGLGYLAQAWTDIALPQLGAWLAGERAAYAYIGESIRNFPEPHALSEEIRAAGFARVAHEPMQSGLVALHQAWKI